MSLKKLLLVLILVLAGAASLEAPVSPAWADLGSKISP
jgi:hypothetical protein